jgi:hypothetical protein
LWATAAMAWGTVIVGPGLVPGEAGLGRKAARR